MHKKYIILIASVAVISYQFLPYNSVIKCISCHENVGAILRAGIGTNTDSAPFNQQMIETSSLYKSSNHQKEHFLSRNKNHNTVTSPTNQSSDGSFTYLMKTRMQHMQAV